MSVGKTEIVLHGFSKIKENVYFIFRNNGLVITSNIDDINTDYIQSAIKDNTIKNNKLIDCLFKKGFTSDYAFVEHSGEYYYTGL
jgi:hypothetical protein